MKVVLDTNVLVTAAYALYGRRSPSGGVGMGVRDWRDDKVVETAMNADADAIVSRDRDLHDARARYAIGKTGIGIRSRPIAVWDVGTFLAVLNGSPRFSPLVVATLAA